MPMPFNKLAQLCLWLCLGVGFVFGAATPIHAIDNDDPTVRVCSVSIGGASFNISDTNRQTAHYVRKDGDDYYFGVKACGLDSSVANCTSDGRQKVVASVGFPLNWDNFELTKRGDCYEGEVMMDEDGAVEAHNVKVDIELNDAAGLCEKRLPLCRRVYGALSSESSTTETNQCTLAINRFKSCSIVNFSTKELVVNKPVSFGVSIDPTLATSCVAKLDYARISIKDPNGNEIFHDTMSGAFNPIGGSCNNGGKFGTCNFSFTPEMIAVCDGASSYTLSVTGFDQFLFTDAPDCTLNFGVGTASEACEPPDPVDEKAEQVFQLCDQIVDKSSDQYAKCLSCLGGEATSAGAVPETPQGIWTAVGCIKTNPQSIVTAIIRIGLGAAGGIALLMILASSFMITTSTGEAKKYNEAREMLTNAIIGLVFIIMSISILQFVGVSLLHIPGFGE